MFSADEQELIQHLPRRAAGEEPVEGEFALGHLLVAGGAITPAELEHALQDQRVSGRYLGEALISAGHTNIWQVERVLRLQRKLFACGLAFSMGLAPLACLAPSAEAAQKSTLMQVSVTVLASARLQSLYQASQLSISASDVAQGYVDISAASRFSVLTNSRTGYLAEFFPVGHVFASVRVDGLGQSVLLGAEGGSIARRGPPLPNFPHELSFRFTLRPETQPGNYPWPLLLTVRPL